MLITVLKVAFHINYHECDRFSEGCLRKAINSYLEIDESLRRDILDDTALLEIRLAFINDDTIPTISYLLNSNQLNAEYEYYLHVGNNNVLIRKTISLPLESVFFNLKEITPDKRKAMKRSLVNNDKGAFVTYNPSIFLINSCKNFEFYDTAQDCTKDIFFLDQF